MRKTAEMVTEKHQGRNVAHILKLLQKFREFGSVGNAKQDGPRVLDETTQIELLEHFAAYPTTSEKFQPKLEFW